MIIANKQREITGGKVELVVINALDHVSYPSISPGTWFPNCIEVDPELFLDMDQLEKDYPLDQDGFHTDAKDAVAEELDNLRVRSIKTRTETVDS